MRLYSQALSIWQEAGASDLEKKFAYAATTFNEPFPYVVRKFCLSSLITIQVTQKSIKGLLKGIVSPSVKPKTNCISLAMAVVDTLLSNKPYKGKPIPETADITVLRWMAHKEEAWLEHKLLQQEHFCKVPLSADPEVHSSQIKKHGVPLYRNKRKGILFDTLSADILQVLYQQCAII